MKNQVDNSFPKVNYTADTSRWLGIISLLPYLILGSMYYFGMKTTTLNELGEAAFVFFLASLLSGIVLGSISLMTGVIALREIRNSQGMETGTRSAGVGIALGMLAMLVNIVFCYVLFTAFINL